MPALPWCELWDRNAGQEKGEFIFRWFRGQFIQADAIYEKGVITSAKKVIFSVRFVCLSAWLTVSRITQKILNEFSTKPCGRMERGPKGRTRRNSVYLSHLRIQSLCVVVVVVVVVICNVSILVTSSWHKAKKHKNVTRLRSFILIHIYNATKANHTKLESRIFVMIHPNIVGHSNKQKIERERGGTDFIGGRWKDLEREKSK